MSRIAGYTYRTETYCPRCVVKILPTGPDQEYDGWALAPGIRMSTEDNLSEIAFAFGIDRHAEHTFDSDVFPKVVLSGQIDAPETCGNCGTDIY